MATSGLASGPLSGHVTTVLGPVAAADLGVTLPHEHVLWDMARSMYVPSPDPAERAAAEAPLGLETLWWVRERPLEHRENIALRDEAVAVRELRHYRAAGGRSLVDCTVRGLHPDPAALARVSQESGVHVVLGTGYYVARTHPADMATKPVEAIADELERDLTAGIDGTGVRAGLIGELGIGGRTAFQGIASLDEVHPDEAKVLDGAARAHRRTGATISIHPPRSRVKGQPRSAMALGLLERLERQGVPPERVILGHLDSSWDEDAKVHEEIARRGGWVEYDVWGWNDLYWPARQDGFLHDVRRVALVTRLLEAGLGHRLLLSHDICTRHRLRTWGGHGYGYLLGFGARMLRAHGLTDADLEALMIRNPARALAR
jgi:phosphotriesterase-related protein